MSVEKLPTENSGRPSTQLGDHDIGLKTAVKDRRYKAGLQDFDVFHPQNIITKARVCRKIVFFTRPTHPLEDA